MPPAARVTDMHTCPMVTPGVPPIPHVGGPILPPGVPTVLIDFLPAATVTDMATCVGPPDVIVKGSAGVFINFLPAARLGDQTAHGGVIVMGSPTCIIGEVGASSPGAGGLAGVVAGLAVSGVSKPLMGSRSTYSSPGSSTDVSTPTTDAPSNRRHTAYDFYAQTGWSQDRIVNHLRGIDFSQPVEVVTLNPGDEVKQWVDPKSNVGNYFDADAPPEELGLCPTNVVPRELHSFVVVKSVKVLKSTAAPILVDWLPTPPVYAKGGATQLFALPANQSSFAPVGSKR